MKNEVHEQTQDLTTELKVFMERILKAHRKRDMFDCVILAAIILSTIFITALIISVKHENIQAHNKIIKKIEYRYFNLSRTLEDIHNVKINTKDGHLFVTE